jgi:hypothetical protein
MVSTYPYSDYLFRDYLKVHRQLTASSLDMSADIDRSYSYAYLRYRAVFLCKRGLTPLTEGLIPLP